MKHPARKRKRTRQLSYSEYLKLCGLHTLAEEALTKLEDIFRAAETLTREPQRLINRGQGEQNESHTVRCMWGQFPVNSLLLKLGIKVRMPAEKKAKRTKAKR